MCSDHPPGHTKPDEKSALGILGGTEKSSTAIHVF